MPVETLILGVPVIVLVPAVVEAMKRAGLAVRWAGLAAVAAAGLLVALADVARRGDGYGSAAGYLLAGLVYGLAASGLYSQVRALGGSAQGSTPASGRGGADGEGR